ncbi:CFI-box-CTERM domain-containing protein [Mordavella massiliensis]|uniref:Uncharacterized protein n=1 Tax=Mordavella massiliensis TaxID=1871024 RepID=A0A938XA36_9CLOT|nr:CFI-box-CTERM domain-containing protein [Mordavella massiliensis]MBM6947703.1 hypothetical protein [Mordavella massiliensis]
METKSLETVKRELVDFFEEMLAYRPYFKRKVYADTFMKCYEEHRELLADITALCSQAEDEEDLIGELAAAIPDHAHGQIEALRGKSRREGRMIDYNMAMVTFVMPVLGYGGSKILSRMIDQMVEKWNQPPMTMQIQRSDFESLKNGFRSHLCYITTAVCKSRGRGDDCRELCMLRQYRDDVLASTPEGRRLVEEYYDVAPTIVSRINRQKDADEIYEEIYRTYLSRCIDLIGQDQPDACQEVYTDMVEELKRKYLFS